MQASSYNSADDSALTLLRSGTIEMDKNVSYPAVSRATAAAPPGAAKQTTETDGEYVEIEPMETRSAPPGPTSQTSQSGSNQDAAYVEIVPS